MKIKELVKLLESLNNPEATIDMACDEEGNAFGDIFEATTIEPRNLRDGGQAYTLYPLGMEMEEERYIEDDEE